jgi:hypothetical protein
MPAPHQSTPAAGGQTDPVDLRSSVYQTLLGKGLNQQQALGVLYSMMGESGTGLDPKASNPNDPGGAIGFAQWVGARRTGLQSLAKSMGTSETDPSAQLAFFNQEISGPYAAEIANVKNNAKTTADATRLWTGGGNDKFGYERPAVNNWAQRFATGSQAASLDASGNLTFKAGPAATVSTAPAAPTTVGGAVAALTKPDDATKKSPLQDMADTLNQAKPAPAAPSQQLLPQAADRGADIAGPSQQLLSQVMAQQAKPLSWSSAPFGSGQAGQIPGTTLNSAYPYG